MRDLSSAPAQAAAPVDCLAIVVDSLDTGGAQRLIEMQAQADRGRRRICVLNLAQPSRLSDSLRRQGIDVVDACLRRLLDPAGLRRAHATLRDWAPDIVHAHLTHATLVGGLFALRSGTPLVVTLHSESPDPGGLFAQIKNILDSRMLALRADAVIACGPRVARGHRGRIGKARMFTVENRVFPAVALHPAERDAMRAGLDLQPADFALLAVGRLDPIKGFDILLQAFALAEDGDGRAVLLLAGDGVEADRLHLLAQQLGIEDRVRFLGERGDVPRLLGAVDGFVLSSRSEGLPLVLLEAMAAGLPVVASDVGDVSTVVGEGGALLVPPENPEELAAALSRLRCQPQLRTRLAARAREAARPYTDLTGMLAELDRIYAMAIEARSRRSRAERTPRKSSEPGR